MRAEAPNPIRLPPAVRAEVAARSGFRSFWMARWVQSNSVVANRRLSLASIRQEQSSFFQLPKIFYATKSPHSRRLPSNFRPSTLQHLQEAVALLFHSSRPPG